MAIQLKHIEKMSDELLKRRAKAIVALERDTDRLRMKEYYKTLRGQMVAELMKRKLIPEGEIRTKWYKFK